MNLDRRGFLLLAGASALSCVAGAEPASAKDPAAKNGEEYGCLVDTTLVRGLPQMRKRLQPEARPAQAGKNPSMRWRFWKSSAAWTTPPTPW
jgi:hypothetical protein